MKKQDFGIMAVNQRAKVTMEPRERGTIISIPTSIGFRQQDKTWVNQFFDLLVRDDSLKEIARTIKKGDNITFNGNMSASKYNDKVSFSFWVDELIPEVKPETQQPPTDDVPF